FLKLLYRWRATRHNTHAPHMKFSRQARRPAATPCSCALHPPLTVSPSPCSPSTDALQASAPPDLPQPKPRHPQQQPAMTEARNVRLAIRPILVTHRHIPNPQIQQRRSEQQIEIAKRIEV